jgi:hypothetical protein
MVPGRKRFSISNVVGGLLLFVVFLLLMTDSPVTAQSNDDPKSAPGVLNLNDDWDPIDFQGRTEFEISDPDKVPRQIVRQITQLSEGCDFKTFIEKFPVRFVSVERERFAFVFCGWVVGSHMVLDLSWEKWRKPKLVHFPFLARESGFGGAYRPGYITNWQKETGSLEIESGSDMCPQARLRHSYRLGRLTGVFSGDPFVLHRVEIMEDSCRRGPWTTIWEAPQWPASTIIR